MKDGLCIFHIPKSSPRGRDTTSPGEKTETFQLIQDFRTAFESEVDELTQRSATLWDFRGFQFPAIDLRQKQFEQTIWFEAATFVSQCSFEGATFTKKPSFNGATFGDGTSFIGVRFGGGFKLGGACSFDGATFGNECSFKNARFIDACSFDGATFGNECSFEGAMFSMDGKKPSFNGATFGDGTSFIFDDATFGNECSFKNATFSNACSFDGVMFGNECSFDGVTFRNECSFKNATTFGNKCSFRGATFGNECSFNEATFGDKCSFSGATFTDRCTFSRAKLGNECSFVGATFQDQATFIGTRFGSDTDFDDIKVHSRLSFDGMGADGSFGGICWFTNLTFEKDSELYFRRTNLKCVSFLGTDVSEIVFDDVQWLERGSPTSRWSCRMIWDEKRMNHRGDFRWRREQQDDRPLLLTPSERRHFYEAVATTYRQLVLNYEARRDFEAAEDFYIGEMDVRRKQLAADAWSGMRWWPWVRRHASSYGAYLILSHYGSSYQRALNVLLAMVLMFAGGFMYFGFREAREGIPPQLLSATSQVIPPPRVVAYRLTWPWSGDAAPVMQVVADAGRALSFVLSIATFQRDRFYEPISVGGQFWLYLAVVAITSQFALTLFAIRRRFKR